MAKYDATIVLRDTNLIQVSSSLHYKDENEIDRKDIVLLKQHSNNITSIAEKDGLVIINIWFESKEKATEFTKEMDKLAKSN